LTGLSRFVAKLLPFRPDLRKHPDIPLTKSVSSPYAVARICQPLATQGHTMFRRTKLAIAAVAVATTALIGAGVVAPTAAHAANDHSACC